MSQENQNIDYSRTLSVARVHNATAREHPDRIAESRSPSVWALFAAVGATALGGTFFGLNGFEPSNYSAKAPVYAGGAGGGDKVDPMKDGEKVYKQACVACHQPAGTGVPGQYPPLDGSEWVVGSDERVATLVLYGLTGPVTVKGATYNGAMPAHIDLIKSNDKFANLMTFIRGSWSNKAPAVTADAIAEVKKKHPGRTAAQPTSQAELEKIPNDTNLSKPPEPAAAAAPAK